MKSDDFLNELIDQMSFELHFPNYELCDAGTKLAERLKSGDVGVNQLDRCCCQYDLANAATKGIGRARDYAILAEQALSRMLNGEASSDKRVAALMTACCMVSKITFKKLLGESKEDFLSRKEIMAKKQERIKKKPKNSVGQRVNDKFSRFYYSPAYAGVDKLLKASRVPRLRALEWLEEQDAYNFHRQVRNKKRRRYL